MCKREREGGRERGRQREGQREGKREGGGERERERDGGTSRHILGQECSAIRCEASVLSSRAILETQKSGGER